MRHTKKEVRLMSKKTDKKAEVIDYSKVCPSFSNQDALDNQCKACAKKKVDLFLACTAATTTAKVAAATSKTKTKSKTTGVPHVSKAQLRAEFVKKAFDKNAKLTRKELASKLQTDFSDSENEARYQAAMSVHYLKAFDILSEVSKDTFQVK